MVSNSFRGAGNNRRGPFPNNFMQLLSCISAKQIGLEDAMLEEVMGSLMPWRWGRAGEKPRGLMKELTAGGWKRADSQLWCRHAEQQGEREDCGSHLLFRPRLLSGHSTAREGRDLVQFLFF